MELVRQLGAETGKHYNYFRDYDASIGRYIQSDPVGLQAGLNTFSYVAQSPLRYIDPYGLDIKDWWDKFWKGQGKDVGKDLAADEVGRFKGAKCAKECTRFNAPFPPEDTARSICLEQNPELQKDLFGTGHKVLQYCVEHCLRLKPQNCPKPNMACL